MRSSATTNTSVPAAVNEPAARRRQTKRSDSGCRQSQPVPATKPESVRSAKTDRPFTAAATATNAPKTRIARPTSDTALETEVPLVTYQAATAGGPVSSAVTTT